MEEESKTVVVIDNGSYTIKAGFAGDDAPRKIFPSYVGYTKKSPINLAMDEKSFYIGDEAKERRGRLEMRRPFVDSLANNWEDVENLWTHTIYNILKITPDDCYIVATESPLNPKKNREKYIEIFFDLFNFEGVYLASKSLLSLYSTGKTTGCIVDSGHGASFSVPIYEGYASPHTIQKLDLGGRHLDDYLNKILAEKGYEFTTPLEKELITEIKEKLCQVKPLLTDIKEKLGQVKPTGEEIKPEYKQYSLPDDSVVRLCEERFDIPEAIFKPSKIGIEQKGLHEVVFKSILKTSSDIRKDMYKNIVFAGGNTLFEGFTARLLQEIQELAPVKSLESKEKREKEAERNERLYAAWIGGSIIGNMEGIQELSVSKKEFEERGVSVVHNKTF